MGSGKARTKASMVYASQEDKETKVDKDLELSEKRREDYLQGRLDFNMTSDEFQQWLSDNELNVAFDWSLVSSGDVEFDENGKAVILNEDLLYGAYAIAKTVVDLRDKLSEVTGLSKDFLVQGITFDSNTRYGGNMLDDTLASTDGALIRIDVDKDSRLMDLDKFLKATGVSVSQLSKMSQKQLLAEIFTKRDGISIWSLYTFADQAADIQSGWHPVSGDYGVSYAAHEMGHNFNKAIHNTARLWQYMSNDKIMEFGSKAELVFGTEMSLEKNRMFGSQKQYDWYERTYDSPVSGYAQRDCEEAFAECFSLYVCGGKSSSKMYKEFETMMSDMGLSELKGCLT